MEIKHAQVGDSGLQQATELGSIQVKADQRTSSHPSNYGWDTPQLFLHTLLNWAKAKDPSRSTMEEFNKLNISPSVTAEEKDRLHNYLKYRV